MKTLGPPDMARIVSQITGPRLGTTFERTSALPTILGEEWPTASISAQGSCRITVAIAADPDCARTLGANMFSTRESHVDQGMIEGALGELADMTAGPSKSAMSTADASGLAEMRETPGSTESREAWAPHFLRVRELNRVLAVATRVV